MTCCEIFAYCACAPYKSHTSEIIDLFCSNFQCELETCSIFSPGIVDDSEVVVFLLKDPNHYDEVTGMITQSAFQEVINRDLSVVRKNVAQPDDMENTAKKIISSAIERGAKKVPEIKQACEASVSEIRFFLESGQRCLGVYDTGLADVASHASIVVASRIKSDKLAKARVKKRLFDVFSKCVVPFGG